MTETDPVTHPDPEPASDQQRASRRTLHDRLPSGRKAVAAGAVLAGLAIGGAGFGAGYAVADGTTDTTTQTTGDWGDRQMPGGGPGQTGEMGQWGEVPGGGPMGGLPGGTTPDDGGTSRQQPDYDGDGQPDTDSDSDPDPDSGSGTSSSGTAQNS